MKKINKTTEEIEAPASHVKTVKDNYTVELKYSNEAIEKKLIKFTVNEGTSFEISVDDIVELVAMGANKTKLQPMFVDTEQIDMVYVKRQLHGKASKAIAVGDDISLDYVHPYPLEFALLEEAYNIAAIDMEVPRVPLTMEYIKSIKEKIKPQTEDFLKASYRSFDLPLDNKT